DLPDTSERARSDPPHREEQQPGQGRKVQGLGWAGHRPRSRDRLERGHGQWRKSGRQGERWQAPIPLRRRRLALQVAIGEFRRLMVEVRDLALTMAHASLLHSLSPRERRVRGVWVRAPAAGAGPAPGWPRPDGGGPAGPERGRAPWGPGRPRPRPRVDTPE